jgi:hypothetical protein
MSTFSHRPFKSLRELLKKNSVEPQSHSSPRKIHDDSRGNEEQLFHRAMDGVREIKSFREIPYRRPKKKVMPGKIPLEEDVLKILKEIVVGSRKIPLKDTQ